MRSVIIVENESLLLSLQHDSEQRTAYTALLNCALYGALQSQYFGLHPPHPHSLALHDGPAGSLFFSMGVVSAAQSHLAGQAVTELGMDAAQLAVYYKHTHTDGLMSLLCWIPCQALGRVHQQNKNISF